MKYRYLVKIIFLSLILTSFCLSQTVYITKSGKKYHLSTCSSLKSTSIPITLEEAISKGYTACKRCNPDSKLGVTNENLFVPEQKVKSKSEVTSQQCEAITKKGTRCSRKAKSGSRYCWQHQK